MITKQKAKITITLIAIFVTGVIAGGFAKSRGHRPAFGNLTDRQMTQMIKELELTDDQIARIQPIVEDISEDIRLMRLETRANLARLYHGMTQQVVSELTAEQTDIFKARQDERRRRAEHMLKQRRMDEDRRGPHQLKGSHEEGNGPSPDHPSPDHPPPESMGSGLLPKSEWP
jgi:hypothetical protein